MFVTETKVGGGPVRVAAPLAGIMLKLVRGTGAIPTMVITSAAGTALTPDDTIVCTPATVIDPVLGTIDVLTVDSAENGAPLMGPKLKAIEGL